MFVDDSSKMSLFKPSALFPLSPTHPPPYPLTGEAHLRPQEEEPGAGEVQVCPGLQDQGAEEADRAQGERHQRHEGADPGDGERAGALPQAEHPAGAQHHRAQAEAQGHREGDADGETEGEK